MNEYDGFYTLKGYQIRNEKEMSAAMEDYLEMIFRLSKKGGDIRVVDLSESLHVKPSSVSKMIDRLCSEGYLSKEKYGEILLSERGSSVGEYLLFRHKTLSRLLCLINKSENETEQVEKIEHFLDKKTVINISHFLASLEK